MTKPSSANGIAKMVWLNLISERYFFTTRKFNRKVEKNKIELNGLPISQKKSPHGGSLCRLGVSFEPDYCFCGAVPPAAGAGAAVAGSPITSPLM